MKNTLVVLVGIVLVFALWVGGQYNSFVTQSNGVDGQWKQVEVQYQRRYDLIPNLLESAKGVQKQEQAVFGAIAEARTRYAGAASSDQKAAAAGQLESALGRLLVIMENYPELKSNETVSKLMDELAGTENRISVERRRYNELVQAYNVKATTIPGNIVASLFGFKIKLYFEATAGSENAPKVQF
ncbi:MAG: LemA family protein [Patescibacteria group bacterium]